MRKGFTLLELTLVMAILVAVAAIATPVALGIWDGHRLIKTGDEVRAIWNRARVSAMRSGQIQVFRYLSLTNEYVVDAFQSDDAYLESSTLQADPMASMAPTATRTLSSERVKFFSLSAQSDLRSVRVEEQLQTQGMGQQPGGALSDAIFFYPDGTSSTARLVLGNDEEQFVVVQLRGLTGLAEVSSLLSFEELPQ